MSWSRLGYTVVVWLAMPAAALYLLWRSRRQAEYRRHWGERFGWVRYPPRGARPLIWVHAVSVGETRAARPLIDALATRYPTHDFLLTHMTPTGRATGAELALAWPGRIEQVYLPYDLPFAVRRFLQHFRPVVGIGMETETWPNLLALAGEVGVPMVLANARLSARSQARAARAPRLLREAAQAFTLVLAQTEADAQRMRAVGARYVEVVGNLKFDMTPDPRLVEHGRAFKAANADRRILLFAVTREGEEPLILDALRRAASRLAQLPACVVIVPRHPQRFDDVERLIRTAGFPVARRSGGDGLNLPSAGGDAPILLGDSMGEMAMYYAAADVAFIGGSLLPLGGQNLIEACAVGTPVVIGPHTFNFAQAAEDAVAAGAARRVADAPAAIETMLELAGSGGLLDWMSGSARRFAEQHRGATARSVERLAVFIDGAPWSASPSTKTSR